jgi:hypothetical protein
MSNEKATMDLGEHRGYRPMHFYCSHVCISAAESSAPYPRTVARWSSSVLEPGRGALSLGALYSKNPAPSKPGSQAAPRILHRIPRQLQMLWGDQSVDAGEVAHAQRMARQAQPLPEAGLPAGVVAAVAAQPLRRVAWGRWCSLLWCGRRRLWQ